MLSVIKKEFAASFIAFGGKGRIALGDRTDLDDLAMMAIKSGNKRLQNMFEKLPTEAELMKHKVDMELAAGPKKMKMVTPPPASVAAAKDQTAGDSMLSGADQSGTQ